MEQETSEDFGGVYYFTNPTKEKRSYLWNNKEYTYEPESRSAMIIANETLENIQEIRKRFALRMARERLYEGELVKDENGKVLFDYNKAKEMGGGLPPTFDESILNVFVQECLKPLEIKRANVKEGKVQDDERLYKATKAMGESEDPNQLFKEETANAPRLGKMPG